MATALADGTHASGVLVGARRRCAYPLSLDRMASPHCASSPRPNRR